MNPDRKNYWRQIFSFFILALFTLSGWTQPSAPDTDDLVYRARGTGQTTGHVVTLSVYNRNVDSIRTVIGPYLIPATGKYQGYVVNRPEEVVLPPLAYAEVALQGYCTNVFKPAVPDGGELAAFEQWIGPERSAPAPGPGSTLAGGFFFLNETPADSIWLTYPGTAVAFPYRIDFDRYPSAAAALLIQVANHLETTAQEMRPLLSSRDNNKELPVPTIVQQVFWQYTARLSGGAYPFSYFQGRLEEQVALTTGEPTATQTKQQREETLEASLDFWTSFTLVGAEAKLTVRAGREEDWPAHYRPWLRQSVDELRPDAPDALARWRQLQDTLPAIDRFLDRETNDYAVRMLRSQFLSLLQNKMRQLTSQKNGFLADWQYLKNLTGTEFFRQYLDESSQADIRRQLSGSLGGYLQDRIENLDPAAPGFLEELGQLQNLLHAEQWQNYLAEADRRRAETATRGKLKVFLAEQIRRLENEPNDRIGQWRATVFLAQTDWFRDYLDQQERNAFEDRLAKILQAELLATTRRLDPNDTDMVRSWTYLILLLQTDFVSDFSQDIHREMDQLLKEKLRAHVEGRIERLNADDDAMFQQWLQLVWLLQTDFIYDYLQQDQSVLDDKLAEKLKSFFHGQIVRLDPKDPDFLPRWADLERALTDDWTPNYLTEEEIEGAKKALGDKFTAALRRRTETLLPSARDFIRPWRTIDLWTKTTWFDAYTVESEQTKIGKALQKNYAQWEKAQRKTADPPPIPWQDVELSHPSFKIPVAVPSPFPVWIPVAGGVAIGGTVVALALTKDDPSPPDPPVALGDAITIACKQPASVNVLSNDTGEGLRVSSIRAPVGITVTDVGAGELQIAGVGAISFTFNYTITDRHGQTAAAAVAVTVTDDAAPEIACPPPVSISCTADTNPANTGRATAVDNCDDDPDLSFSEQLVEGRCANTLVRTWTAADQSGKRSSCEQAITLIDDQPPTVECPADITLSANAPRDPDATGAANAVDQCGSSLGEITLNFVDDQSGLDADGLGPLVRIWTAADACNNAGSCAQTIVLIKPTVLKIDCPPDLAISCADNSLPEATGTATIEGDCPDDASLIFADRPTAGDCPGERTIRRLWTATDPCGNRSECAQVITIQDKEAPQLTCPPAVNLNLDGDLTPQNTGRAEASDNCSAPQKITLEYQDDTGGLTGCAGSGTIRRTWTAADECGNTRSCTQNIRLRDSTPPRITCPVPATAAGLTDIDPVFTGQASALDNASTIANIAIAYADNTGALDGCGGILKRRWTATDECGNVSACTQDIIIVDTEAPVLNCPPTVEADCSALQDLALTGQPSVTDNYSSATGISLGFTDNQDELTPCAGGDVIRTWTAVDACENSASCEQVIRVRADSRPPNLECPPNIAVVCGQETDFSVTGVAQAEDDCSAEITFDFSDDLSGLGGDCNGTLVRIWTAIDPCGNTTSCKQNITVTPAETGEEAPLSLLVSPGFPLLYTDPLRRLTQTGLPLEQLRRFLPEHPSVPPPPDFQYFCEVAVPFSLGYALTPRLMAQVDLLQAGGRGVRQWTLPSGETAAQRSPFRETVAVLQFRQVMGDRRLQPSLGLSGQWRRLKVGNSSLQIGSESYLLSDAQQIRGFDLGLTGGWLFSISPRIRFQLQGQWYPFGESGKRFGIWQGVIVW